LRWRGSLAQSRLLWPILGLGLLLVIDLIFIPNFFRVSAVNGRLTGTLIEIFRWSGSEILLAIGMTLVLATGGVDLSVGAVMALSGAVIAELSSGMGWTPGAAVLAAIVVCVAAGAWNGALVTLLDIQPIVATLVLMVAGRGIAQTIGGSAHLSVSGKIFDVLGSSVLGIPTEGLVGLLVLALTAAFVRLTSAGLLIEATGGNPTASRYAGVNVKLVTFLVYAFCGLCAGLAGLLQTADLRGADASQMGIYWELDAILAAVLGGTSLTGGRFSLAGAVLGALLIVTLTTSIQSKVPVEYALVAKALVVIIICLLQSQAFRRKVLRRK
jgi:ribose/xylose/arabinose/galactoside ABC-type transport system permease subunit